MRTRYLKLIDYGIDKEEAETLRELAKKKENETLVRVAAENAKQGISDFIFVSLSMGKGYREIGREMYVPALENDFYAYKRRALYIFKLLLIGREAEARKNADGQEEGAVQAEKAE